MSLLDSYFQRLPSKPVKKGAEPTRRQARGWLHAALVILRTLRSQTTWLFFKIYEAEDLRGLLMYCRAVAIAVDYFVGRGAFDGQHERGMLAVIAEDMGALESITRDAGRDFGFRLPPLFKKGTVAAYKKRVAASFVEFGPWKK